jgi:WD40 repeat protein
LPAKNQLDPSNKPVLPHPDAEKKDPVDKRQTKGPSEKPPNPPAATEDPKLKLDLVDEHKEFDKLHSVLLSPDGNKIALGGSNEGTEDSIVVRSVAGWEPVRGLSAADESFAVLAFSADGAKLLTGVQTKETLEARSYDLRSGAAVRFRNPVRNLTATCGAYSPDGRWVVIAFGDAQGDPQAGYRLSVFNRDNGQEFRAATLPLRPPHAVVFASDSARVLTCDSDNSIHEYTVQPGELRTLYHAPKPTFAAAAFGADGRSLVVRTASMQLLQYTLEPFGLRRVITPKTPEHQTTSLAVSESSELIVVGMEAPGMPRRSVTAALLDMSSGRVIGQTKSHPTRITAASVSQRARLLATADEMGSIRLWRWDGGPAAGDQGN